MKFGPSSLLTPQAGDLILEICQAHFGFVFLVFFEEYGHSKKAFLVAAVHLSARRHDHSSCVNTILN